MRPFADRTVDLWFARPERLAEAQLETLYDLLTPDERAKTDRYRRPEDHALRIVGRGMLRLCLSECAELAPDAWRFVTGPYGKPSVDRSQPPFFFNVSHTRGLAVCAVNAVAEIGVDAERIGERKPLPGAANLREWTAREAIAKAIGLGLALPFEHILRESESEYCLSGDAPVEAGTPARWRILRAEISPEHEVAIAVLWTALPPVNVRVIDLSGSGLIG